MGVANAVMGGKTPIKYFNEDGTRSVEVHTSDFWAFDKIVLKDGENTIIKLDIHPKPRIVYKQTRLVQDFLDDKVNYNHLFVGFVREYIEEMYEERVNTSYDMSFICGDVIFTYEKEYHLDRVTIELPVKNIGFYKEFCEFYNENSYKKICNISIAELMAKKPEELVLFASRWSVKDYIDNGIWKCYMPRFSIKYNNIDFMIDRKVYHQIRSSKYLRESDVFKKGELFHLTEKQLTKATKANVFKKTCIISKINLDGTVELKFE